MANLNNSVDSIFELADQKMLEQSKKQKIVFKDKKKRKHTIVKYVIGFFSMSLALILCFSIYIINIIRKEFPNIKTDFLQQYSSAQEKAEERAEDSLTVKEYYEKQIILLLPSEKLEERITSTKDMLKIKNILTFNNSLLNRSILTEEEMKTYKEIYAEYDKYIRDGGDPDALYSESVNNPTPKNNSLYWDGACEGYPSPN